MPASPPPRQPRRGGPKRSGKPVSGRPARPTGAGGKGRAGAPKRSTGGAAKRTGRPERADRPERARSREEDQLERDRQAKAKGAGWGGVARKGAGRLDGRAMGAASQAWREAVGSERGWKPEEWIDEGEVAKVATQAVGRGQQPDRGPQPRRRQRDERPPDPGLAKQIGVDKAKRFEDRIKNAAEAFKRQRFDEAKRLLKPLAEGAPGSEVIRELYGLTLYRLGRWKPAVTELEAFRTIAGSTEQHPVLADCYRALGRHREVEALWEELRSASPSAELVAEGRIVMAGSLADQGRLPEAIALLQRSKLPSRRPREHHLRVAYALADLYERAGETPKARELFMVVATNDPEFADVRSRLKALR